MKTIYALLALFLFAQSNQSLAFSSSSNKHQTSPINTINSRNDFLKVATTATATAAAAAALLLTSPSPALAITTGAEAFVGTYSDPNNHPGGKRTIRLLDDAQVGDYRLAEVIGGGGIGEPKNYVLPAVVIGDRTIVIDFSPKGGPRDFVGVLEKDNIRFLRDKNLWPRLKE